MTPAITDPTPNQLRVFSIIMAAGATLVEGLFIGPWFGWGFRGGLIFMAIGVIAPFIIRPIYHPWLKFAAIIGFINIRIILGVSYFIIITPMALYFKLIKRDILKLIPKDQESFWETYDKHDKTVERYRRLF